MEDVCKRHLKSSMILLFISFCLNSTADVSKQQKSACRNTFKANVNTLRKLAVGTAKHQFSQAINRMPKISRRSKQYKLHNKRLIEIAFFPIEKIPTIPPEEFSMLSKREVQHLRLDHLRLLSPEQAAQLDENKLSPLQKKSIIAPPTAVPLAHLTEQEFQSIPPLHISFYYNNLTEEQKRWVTAKQFTGLTQKQKQLIAQYLNKDTIQSFTIAELLELKNEFTDQQKTWLTLTQFRQIKDPYDRSHFAPYPSKDNTQSLTGAELLELEGKLTDQQKSWITLTQLRQIANRWDRSQFAPYLSKDNVQNLTGKELKNLEDKLTDQQKSWITLTQFRQIKHSFYRSLFAPYLAPHLSKDILQNLTGEELEELKAHLTDQQKSWITLTQFRQIKHSLYRSHFAPHLSKDILQNLTGEELEELKAHLTDQQKSWITTE